MGSKKNNKKTIGAITFHASYNHGSVLQAYALQEFINEKFGEECYYEIINLRTERQKSLYNKPFGSYDAKSCLKKIMYLPVRNAILRRKRRYEEFIGAYLNLTKEYKSLEELKDAKLSFDYYISGSDQIWNYSILDFDWSFFLEFCCSGKKIAYAASFGPKQLLADDAVMKRISRDLSSYSKISIREAGSLVNLRRVAGDIDAEVNIDPTMLLTKEKWSQVAGKRLINEDYILLYDLKGKKESYEIAYRLSQKYNLPVVVVRERMKMDLIYRRFLRKIDAGPIEFLNYTKYAKLVISSSFHGNVFSILFERPFISIGGIHDDRIGNLLKELGLEHRSVDNIGELEDIKNVFSVNYKKANRVLCLERRKSLKYLRDALDIVGKE